MSDFKFSSNLFLEKQELDRFYKFLTFGREIINRDTFTYGILRHFNDPNFLNFKVEAGTNPKTIKLGSDSIAVAKDSDSTEINLIKKVAEDNISVPDDGQFYWVKIAHLFDPKEVGIVSIDTEGNLTGVGTKFTEILRGKPNFPSKIKFYGSIDNIYEYEVNDVASDTSLTLSGEFTAETNLRYSVIGTFTPGYSVPSGDKEIFQYDSCTLSFELETVLDVPPVKTDDFEFYIARVKVVGSIVTIEDKRTEIWKLSSTYYQTVIEISSNPLIGVESVKWGVTTSPRNKNEVNLSWGFRTTNWTIDTSLRKLTIISGLGGKFKDTTYFTTNDFNGWRLYDKQGNYKKIIESVKSGSQINLTVDSLNNSDYTAGDELLIVPPVEEIQIKIKHDDDVSSSDITDLVLVDDVVTFPINIINPKLYLEVPVSQGVYKYNLQFRHKKFETYTEWTNFPDDSIGYLEESSFNNAGVLVTSNYKPYVGSDVDAFIELVPNPTNYVNTLNRIDLGDKLGIDTVPLSNATPVLQLTVGDNRQYEYFAGGDLVLSSDMYINLKSINVDGDPCRNGNFFLLHFKQKVDFATFKLRIVSDYISPISYTLLQEFDVNDQEFLATSKQGIFIRGSFDGSAWIVNNVNESNIAYVKVSEMIQYDPVVNATALDTLVPTLTYTSPNDGVTRRLFMTVSTTGNTDIHPVAAAIQLRIFDVTNSAILDNTNLQQNDLPLGSSIGAGLNLQYLGDVLPNTTFEVQFAQAGSDGGGYISKSKFIIQELK